MRKLLSLLGCCLRTTKSSQSDSALPITSAPSRPPTVQCDAALEKLPPEIRRHILFMLDLEDLCALVHASPTFHMQYRLDRRRLLCSGLEATLLDTTVDAHAAYRTSFSDFPQTLTEERVASFLKSYQDELHSPLSLRLADKCSEEDAVNMVVFFRSVIRFLIPQYSSWALDTMSKKTGCSPNHEPTTSAENMRLSRALYRFQLYCNLFGSRGQYETWKMHWKNGDHMVLDFIYVFEPWEVEEIASLHFFANDKLNKIFADVEWDINPRNPRFGNGPIPPWEFDMDCDRRSYLNHFICFGPNFWARVLGEICDRDRLISTMLEHTSMSCCNNFEQAWIDSMLIDRRSDRWPTARDYKQARRDPLPFNGDSAPDGNVHGPPLAWTLMWGGTYSNVYGDDLPRSIRTWGFPIWDAARLEQTGVIEFLMRACAHWWGDEDGRDSPEGMFLRNQILDEQEKTAAG